MDNQNDRFASGFLAGTIFGSVVGGLVGTLLASRLSDTLSSETPLLEKNNTEGKLERRRRRQFKPATELSIEEARQGLEQKIAQLNEAIDEARQQLSNVNGQE